MGPQQLGPEKLFAIIGEQQVQLILAREQAQGLARLLGEKNRQLEITTGALEAIKAQTEEAEESAR